MVVSLTHKKIDGEAKYPTRFHFLRKKLPYIHETPLDPPLTIVLLYIFVPLVLTIHHALSDTDTGIDELVKTISDLKGGFIATAYKHRHHYGLQAPTFKYC